MSEKMQLRPQLISNQKFDAFALARRLQTPIWIYDTDGQRIAFANAAACKLWNSEDEAALKSRDLSEGMTKTVANRLRQYQTDFLERDAVFNETWTIFPNDSPVTLDVRYSGFQLADGRMGMMCEVIGNSIKTTETLRSTQALLHTDVLIALLSHEGHPLYQNPAARSRFPNKETPIGEVFVDQEDLIAAQKALKGTGESHSVTRIKMIDGPCWVDLTVKKCLDTVTGEQAFLVNAIDVSELKATEAALTSAKETAELANIAKSEFLATMSHEIRTPMNGVIGMIDVLQRTPLSENQKLCTDIIYESGENLLAIINNILDYSKIEAHQITLDLEPGNLKDSIDHVINLLGSQAQEKGLTLNLEYAPNLPAKFIMDRNRVVQILTNLIGNAIKFTPKGSVTVKVSGRISKALADIKIDVVDTGIGIEESKLAYVFEKFTQAESSTTRKYGGTGIGLAISKGLADVMNGQISVSSIFTEGSTFTLQLPLRVVLSERPPMNDSQVNFLVVGADADSRAYLAKGLKHPRINLVFCETRPVAFDVEKAERFDIIIFDVDSAGQIYADTLEDVRKQIGSLNSYMIGLTGTLTSETKGCYLRSGIDDILVKPLQKDRVLKAVSKGLKVSRLDRNLTHPEELRRVAR